MEKSTPAQITQALEELGAGCDTRGWEKLLPLVYDELHQLSERSMRRERPDHTLQPTALVNEVFVRLSKDGQTPWKDRGHFFRVAARVMRHVLINHARDRCAQKRGGGGRGERERQRVGLDEADQLAAPDADGTLDLVALDEALESLARVDEEKARVVELRFFGGCTIDETAEALGISTASVERSWRFARSWLQARLEPDA